MDKEAMSPSSIIRALEQDFKNNKTETFPGEKAFSQEDQKVLKIDEKRMELDCGHYTLPLPFRDDDIVPDNTPLVLTSANLQKRRMINDSKFREHCVESMDKILDSCYAAKVPEEQDQAPEDQKK